MTLVDTKEEKAQLSQAFRITSRIFSGQRRIDRFNPYLWVDKTSDVAQRVPSRVRKSIQNNHLVKEKDHV